MLAGSEFVRIDDEDLLKDLEALTLPKPITVEDEDTIKLDGERIDLPSVPKEKVHLQHEFEHKKEKEHEPEKEKEKVLVAE